MKQKTVTRGTMHFERNRHRRYYSEGKRASSITPPNYGIGFVDHKIESTSPLHSVHGNPSLLYGRPELEGETPDWSAPIDTEADIREEGGTAVTMSQQSMDNTDSQRSEPLIFPSYATISGDATVKSEAQSEWQQTLSDASATRRRERGFWIRWNENTSSYSITGRVQGPWRANNQGATIGLGTKPADSGSEYTVASFHTHTPTKYRAVGRPVGPSSADHRVDTRDNVAGVVYDYVAADSSGNIPAGHALKAPPKLYHSGPTRRT